jgi:transposase InsO family protein
LCIEPGAPRENGYVESFNGKYVESFNGSLRDELLDGETFYTLKEAKAPIEQWRKHYNTIRPHSALGYRPPAPEATAPPTGPVPLATFRSLPSARRLDK